MLFARDRHDVLELGQRHEVGWGLSGLEEL
jgi:hypothetical protein